MPSDDLATAVLTVVDPARGPSSAPPAASSSGAADQGQSKAVEVALTAVITPADALREVEARRAWAYALGLCVMCLLGIALVVAFGGDPLGQKVHGGALAVTACMSAAYVVFRRDARKFKRWQPLVTGYVSIAVTATGFFYWGIFSSFAAVVPLSCYVFASTNTRRGSIIGTGLTLAVQIAIGGTQLAGWVAPHGLMIAGPSFGLGAQIVWLVLMQVVVVAATLGGIDNQRTMTKVLDDYHAATREILQRDALLAEARARIRDARGPAEGRYSGQVVGRFHLGAVIGRGAMGEVYSARDGTGVSCAVKVLAAHLVHDTEMLKRFHREARAISALQAPNIVRMIDVSAPDAAVPFFAMEKLEGKDLGELLQEQPRRELAEVVAIITAAAAGLDAAHAAGVIHRDLKPANIFASGSGTNVIWKLLDFGVSKLTDAEATATVGQLVGTPGYMAPEQARGDKIDHRADVYALGAVTYRMLTGTPAVVPGELPAMVHEVVYRMPPQPSSIAPVSAAVESVLALALAKSPGDRFARAGELAAELAAAAAGLQAPDIRARAADILKATPWGSWLRRAAA